ncbi:MAG: LacI family DNA-binding transcriptional regulator [Lachnospiraceae bacterium]|nr:LacI family DNA-binding transcriptional regulator [Lachnospiraceae bacterium]
MRPKKKIGLKNIAEAAGVSVVTVSNALSGKKGVSDEKRNLIMKKAEELGFSIDKYKNNTDSTVETDFNGKVIGVLVSDFYISIGTSFYWEMYQNVTSEAAKCNCMISLYIAKERSGDSSIPSMIEDKSIDGLIIIGRLKDNYLEEVFNKTACPIVLMDFVLPERDISAVLSSNYLGMYKSTKELIKAGHTKIGFVGTMGFSHNIGERMCGYQRCMVDNGLNVLQKWILSDRIGKMETPYISLPDELPTAFACSSDYAASILYDALKLKGLRVPEDISIASYDNYLYGHVLSGRLTTFNVDMETMAERAVGQLLEEIKDPSVRHKIEYVDSKMILRDSIKKLNNC